MTDGGATLAELGTEQVRLIGRARDFLAAAHARGMDVALHPECYMSGWSNVPGNARLRRVARERGARVRWCVERAKDAANVLRLAQLHTAGAELSCDGYDQLVVSWCRGADFASDGEYRDRYFHTSSRETPRTLWLTLATDEQTPAKFDANVRVLRRRPGARRFSPLLLGREFLRGLRRGRRAEGRVPLLSATVTHAERVVDAVSALLRRGKFRTLVMPYEAQPFQHAVYRAAKGIDAALRTVGYLHSALPPLPTDLTLRAGAPELLLVHGAGQIDILELQLGWPRERMRAIPALRYREHDAVSLAGFIFLPMNFSSAATIVAEFAAFVAAAAPGSLAPLVVRNHPVMRESRVHLQLQRDLDDVLTRNADRFCRDPKGAEPLSVFIGATAAIIEALERGVSVVHICSRPLMEAHTPDVWPAFEVKRLGRCLFRYRMRTRGAYISFGSENDMFGKYIRESIQ